MINFKFGCEHTLVHSYIGDVCWGNAREFYYELLARLGDETKTYKNLVVPIGSSGGELDAAWALYDMLSTVDINVVTIAIGKVYSAGTIPFMAGDQRYIYSKAMLLFHSAVSLYEKAEVNMSQVKEEILAEKVDSKLLSAILKDKISPKEVKNLCSPKKSIFLTADEALKMGLITKVIDKYSQVELL